jgi:hypothetical protein
VLSFCAFCSIDLRDFLQGMKVLLEASELTKVLISQKLKEFETAKANGVDNDYGVSIESLKDDLFDLHRMGWILQYHMALCSYMTQQYEASTEVFHCMLSFNMYVVYV